MSRDTERRFENIDDLDAFEVELAGLDRRVLRRERTCRLPHPRGTFVRDMNCFEIDETVRRVQEYLNT